MKTNDKKKYQLRRILGISAFYHDSAACIIEDGKIVAAAQEERFTREKHTAVFPMHSIRFCLEYAGFTIDELDAVVFYDKPLLKFERLLETFYAFAPKGLRSFLKAMPIWAKEKIYLKKVIIDHLREIENFEKKNLKLLFSEHHLSHAASAFYPSPYEEAAILTIDGVGEWSTTSISRGQGGEIEVLKEMHFPHSLGLLYSSFTYFLGFKVNSGEYKMMGLAPYGDPHSKEINRLKEIIYSTLIDSKEDGSIWVNQDYFDYAVGLRMINETKWEVLFEFPRREPEGSIDQHHCNLALAIQQITEEVILKMATEAKRITSSRNICLAGGVALNCVANGKLLRSGLFDKIFIQPAAGDAGGSLGAALAAHYLYFKEERVFSSQEDSMQGALLGPDFSDKEVKLMSRKNKATFRKFEDFIELSEYIACELAQSKIVGWFQGKAEFGPRALGNRSILADPRDPQMQKKLNLKIKFREQFRPFAPAILTEYKQQYFELNVESPYMLLVSPIRQELKYPLSDNDSGLSLMDKLYQQRSPLNSITHVDFSARIQTVDKVNNPKFYQLIDSFRERTDCPILINTSFNVRDEPIVNTPQEAFDCFIKTEMDFLVINSFVFDKRSM